MIVNQSRLRLTPPAPFDFRAAAFFHGWVVLAPNIADRERQIVHRVQQLSSGKVVLLRVSGSGSIDKPRVNVTVRHPGKLTDQEKGDIRAAIGRMLRLDEDFSEFYADCRRQGSRGRKLARGRGRLLRSPTVFEDVVKTICTTNIQWTGTKRLVEGLVQHLGEPFADDPGLRSFPTPERVATAPPRTFTETVRMGYRGAYVHELARKVASGALDLEALLTGNIPTPELKNELLALKGVGPYAAATLLMLLGRYGELAVDSGFRQFVSRKYFQGRKVADRKAAMIYDGWGRWKYLAYWFDMIEDYLEDF